MLVKQGNAAVSSMLGLMCDGGYAEWALRTLPPGGLCNILRRYCTVDESAFVQVPSGWSAAEAAPVMSTFGTVWQGAFVRGGATRER
jgi:NADPH:quinone reductase-like Zn-dependent oxidoreductase